MFAGRAICSLGHTIALNKLLGLTSKFPFRWAKWSKPTHTPLAHDTWSKILGRLSRIGLV